MINAKEYQAKQETQKNQKSRLFRCETLNDLQGALLESKNNNRTPLIISTIEGQIKYNDLIDTLENDGTKRNI